MSGNTAIAIESSAGLLHNRKQLHYWMTSTLSRLSVCVCMAIVRLRLKRHLHVSDENELIVYFRWWGINPHRQMKKNIEVNGIELQFWLKHVFFFNFRIFPSLFALDHSIALPAEVATSHTVRWRLKIAQATALRFILHSRILSGSLIWHLIVSTIEAIRESWECDFFFCVCSLLEYAL